MMGGGAFENPLVSHARMRGLFRALVETRVLSREAGRGRGWRKGTEACWVGTALDLRDGDLVSCGANAWLVEHVREVGARERGRAATQRELRRTLRTGALEAPKKTPATARDRLLCAVGQAMALKGIGKGVVLAYAEPSLKPMDWNQVAAIANEGDLPLVIVALPGPVDVAAAVAGVRGTVIPVIPVDAGDPLALYRVTQEMLVRARTDGGVAIIECVDVKTDPIAQMAAQLVRKGICTERWVASAERGPQQALKMAGK